MINTFPSISTSNQPRGLLTANGINLPFEEFKVVNNNVYEADEFEATIPIQSLPQTLTEDNLSIITAIFIEIYLGYPANPISGQYSTNDLDTVFAGQVDDISFSDLPGYINISGRDLTAKFIDNKTTEKFQNLTFSQIATLLAQRRGLTPVITPTTTPVGVFYQNNNTKLTREQSEWDLLVFLAQQENFLIYVDGLNLIAEPQPAPSTNPFLIQWQPANAIQGSPLCNVINPQFSRALTIAKDVIVKVRSHTLGSIASYTVTATATHNRKTFISGKAQPVGEAQVYSYNRPGLTREQALQLAQQKLREITLQEINFEFEIPGINLIKKDSIIQTQGFAEGLNQTYYPNTITRHYSATKGNNGYQMTVHAKNHSPISVVLV